MIDHVFIATQLNHTASQLAGHTTSTLLESEAQQAGIVGGFREWQAFIESRISDLSAAIMAQEPRIFASQVQWCVTAMQARTTDPISLGKILGTSIQILGKTISREIGREAFWIESQYIEPALKILNLHSDAGQSILDVESKYGRAAAKYILAILQGDRRAAATELLAFVEHDLSLDEIYERILAPACKEIGRFWQEDEISVAEEHFATSTSQQVMAQLLSRFEPQPHHGQTLIACCVSGNRHELGVRMTSDLMELRGWRVVYLGPDVPVADIARSVIDFKPTLVMLSVAIVTQLHALRLTCEAIKELPNSPKIMVGGTFLCEYPDLALKLGADFVATEFHAACNIAHKLAYENETIIH